MSPEDIVRLRHMLDAARKAVAFSTGRQRSDLDLDEMFGLAITRLLEILGEAAKMVSPAGRSACPHIPWKQLAGTRDRLIHAYFNVNFDIVWQILTSDLPALIPQIEAALRA